MLANKQWWQAAGVRALRTFAQTILSSGIVLPSISAATDWLSAGWTLAAVVGSALGAAILSLLTSIAGLPEVEKPE